MTRQQGLSIGELSDATGVKSVTLRAWERRHGLLKPRRSEGGHRLYRERDVARVMAIRGWLEQGVSIGRVRPLLEQRGSGDTAPDLGAVVEACVALNGRHLEQLFNEQSRSQLLSSLYQEWIAPVRRELMARGASAALALAFWDRFLVQKLAARVLKESRQMPQRPDILVQCLPGADSHPAPAICQLLAMEEGWPCVMLGQPLTAATLARSPIAEQLGARVLVVAPGSRLADLRQACSGVEKLPIPHLLLNISDRQVSPSGGGMRWLCETDSPSAIIDCLRQERDS